MNALDEDLNDSSLFCKSLIHKRKATWNGNPKSTKQLRLQFSSKINQPKGDKLIKVTENDNCTEGNIESSNSKCDESMSSYFSIRKSVNTCPLCSKSFKSDSAYSAHMKQCAKMHKMTTQQLLSALELQKKQMQERRNLGLCLQRSTSLPKTTVKKKNEKDIEQYDLALGLALSKSLSTAETNGVGLPESQKTSACQTLEEFGFISKNAVAVQGRRKNDTDKKSVLKDRTEEERQRIIIEKVAVILLDENQEIENENSNPFENSQVPRLWNMGENNERHSWYVNGIKTLLLPEEENSEKTSHSIISDNIEKELSEMNLPRQDIHKDWNKLINSSKLSDLTAKTKDSRDVHLHSVVLYARCPEMLEKDFESVFLKFNLSTVLIFLEFVYCGTLNSLVRTEITELYDLAVDFNYDELVKVLNCLRSNLTSGRCDVISDSPLRNVEKEISFECEKMGIPEDKDLFAEDESVNPTENNKRDEASLSENESNSEKSYWSFLQHEKKKEKLDEMKTGLEAEESDSKDTPNADKVNELQRIIADDSATRDLDEDLKKTDKMSDCIILSSGSESRTQENVANLPRTPSPIKVHCEVPPFDPYDNFFAEEQFSPVGVHSQSLLSGDISLESLKSSDICRENGGRLNVIPEEEPKKVIGYCSTPVTVHHSSKVNGTNPVDRSRKRKRDLSSSRIIRKSLGLQQKTRISSSVKKINSKRKDLAQALTTSILHELSKSSVFQSSPPTVRKRFVEMTPLSNRDEFVDMTVTPSPNYSNLGESVIKEQLTKYGLKKNLAKSKAKKILRYIYEELHPLYNTETGKIVKMLPGDTTKPKKKEKPKFKQGEGKKKPAKKRKSQSKSPKEAEENSDGSGLDIDRLSDYDTDESEFGNLNESLTQSTPSNPVDLSSAFYDFLENNPDYHQKILLYEPIWLEELQKKLKEAFKKHFKVADLMDFLDQKCITFRSEAQARNNEKKRGTTKKKKNHSG